MKSLNAPKNIVCILTSLMLVCLLQPAHAALPGSMTYQGCLTDSGGTPVDDTVDITFRIYEVDAGGPDLWIHTLPVTVANGVFSVELGGPVPFPAGLFEQPLWLGLEVGTNGEMTPRQPITSTAFAFKAQDANRLEGSSAASLDQSSHVNDLANPHNISAAQSGAASTGDFSLHTGDPSAHHFKTTKFTELVGQASNPQIPAMIARNAEIMPTVLANDGVGSGLNADLLDGLDSASFLSPWIANGTNLFYDAGRVGIGTSTPGAGLELEGSGGYSSALSLNNTGGGLEWRLTSWTDGTFRLVKSSGTTFSAIVVEPVDGAVGIGTSTPDQQLQVHTNSGTSYIRVSDNTSGVASGLRMGLSGSGNAYIINDEPAKALSIGTDGTSQMRITDVGHVGINELSPDMMLHLKQDVANKGLRIEHQSTTDNWESGIGTTTKNYKFYYNNLFRADISSVDGAYTQSSDRRLKEDIRKMDAVLPKLKQLKASSYHYLGNKGKGKRSIGFVAQDVEPVFPDLVRETEDGMKGLVYDGFAVISVKAIQELSARMEEMQREIDELRAKVGNEKR